jgi:predicted nucleic acid-binding protein
MPLRADSIASSSTTWEATRCANSRRLPIIGTLGIVGRATVVGMIDRAAPAIRRLREAGLYTSVELAARLLREAGESG